MDDKKVADTKARVQFWHADLENIQAFTTAGSKLISQVSNRQPGITVLSNEMLDKYFPSPAEYQKHCLNLETGQEILPGKLIGFFVENGYEIADTASEPGFYAKKGGVIEVCSASTEPTRILFDANTIEKIETFDPRSKKSGEVLEQILVTPHKLPSGKNSLLRFIEENSQAIIAREGLDDFPKTKTQQIVFKTFGKGQKRYDTLPASLYYGNLRLLQTDLAKLISEGYKIQIFTDQQESLAKTLGDLSIEYHGKNPSISIGYLDAKQKIAILSDHEIFGKQEIKQEKTKIDQSFLASLKPGDYVVHLDHGVGKFIGMQKHIVDEGEREYFVLEYAEGDKLSVPVEYADKLDRYIGKSNPTINRLHGARWNQVKRKIKVATREIAGELLKLYAARQAASGYEYNLDTPEQIELERSFRYEDTPGQRQVTEEIKRDMENIKPMDRLLVGDVGYGKTEISIRAAFKAVQSGKQVAFLCPTTVLAEQHGKTYQARLKNFPVKVAVLSRFKTPAEQRQILEDLKSGETDIVIGTHRLLSKDIAFKDLGLIVLDEEQRFGVEHKEKLKKLRSNVDVLTMTATPIPRTLHFSLSGIRDISTIDTPPPGRQPIDTHIEPYNEELIAKAIRDEIKRKGQVYFLHNRVETIEAYANKLRQLIPEATFAVAHGQMGEKKLSSVMHDFYHRKYDVLVCSTIIESGLDIKNVNTLVVDESTRFGLAQLYQLRGRIGRGSVKAQAYFFYHSKKLKGRSKDRLQALLEARELGAGFKIAMRDMEIRGAGNLLGREQSGSINTVGLSLYSRLLHQAVEEAKLGKPAEPQLDVSIDLPMNAYIPKGFFPSEERRLRTYRELANLTSIDQLHAAVGKLVSQSRACYTKKDLPQPILNLFSLLEIKLLAQQQRILSIDTMIKQKPDSEKSRILNITFAEDLDDTKFWDVFASKVDGWETRDERSIRIELSKLGNNWLEELKKILS
ncbi:transcription-repair coupling factor [Patescibacteria group bacterium]